jgi:hypothetical protein
MNQAEAMNQALLIYAKHVVGWAAPESLIDGAVALLERDVDTAAVRLMAGYAPGDHPEDLRTGFRALLHSLGAPNLERVNWNCLAGRKVCQDTLEGKLEPWQAARRMYALWCDTNQDPRFERWMRLDDSRDLVLSGYEPIEPFDDFTLENADQVVYAEAERFLEQNPETTCLTKES